MPEFRFIAEGREGEFANQPEWQGFYDHRYEEPRQLTNFNLFIEEDVHVEDELQTQRRFRGRIELLGQDHPFSISAEDYANNNKLSAAIFEAAGAKVKIDCPVEVLRMAISEVSNPTARRASANFGWNEAKDAYLVPGGRITGTGFREADENDIQIDLSEQEFARRLNMRPLMPDPLAEVKRHVVTDLLPLCSDLKVGYSLIGAVALSVLYRFTDGMNRPLIWIEGLSGGGKSHLAKLMQNFFGDFPIAGEKSVISWVSTVKRIQYEGYYFRDALYLVDDYKPEYCKPTEATWLLQGYADSAARSRLRRDGQAAESREIRGLLVCTGEDVPDHSASRSSSIMCLMDRVPLPRLPRAAPSSSAFISPRPAKPQSTTPRISPKDWLP
jgi:hypothetical protein